MKLPQPPEGDASPRVLDLRTRDDAGDAVGLPARLAAAEGVRDRLALELRDAQGALQDARADLAERIAQQAPLIEELARLRAELAAAAARAAALADGDGVLGRLATELAGVARAARQDVEVHLSARGAAEARLVAVEGELAAERARAERAQTSLRLRRLATTTATPTDPAALAAARERLAPAPAALAAPAGLVDDLARASERLRLAAAQESPGDVAPRGPERVRRLLRRLFG